MEDEEIVVRLLQVYCSIGKIVTTHQDRSSLSDPLALTDQEPRCQALRSQATSAERVRRGCISPNHSSCPDLRSASPVLASGFAAATNGTSVTLRLHHHACHHPSPFCLSKAYQVGFGLQKALSRLDYTSCGLRLDIYNGEIIVRLVRPL